MAALKSNRGIRVTAFAVCAMLFGAATAVLADQADCTAVFGANGTFTAGECQVSGALTLTGTQTLLDDTVHLLTGAVITVGSPSLTLNITGPNHGLIMDAGSMIDGGDRDCFGADAKEGFPITINADGDIDVKGPSGATPGAIIRSNGCTGGAIAITTTPTHTINIDGLVQSVGRATGTGAFQSPGGGPITIVAGCKLTISDTGHVISQGRDPGADLVHLEGCEVVIYGIVESIAVGDGGHALPNSPENHCNLDPASHRGGGSMACVEIWGNTIVIDDTNGHNGEVDADGTQSNAWIDILAKGDITVIAATTGHYAVHANPASVTNQVGGQITLKSQMGKVVTTALVPGTVGLAIQASSFPAGGSGGDVIVQAGGAAGSGNVDFTADSVQVIANSNSGHGGTINGQSFNDNLFGVMPGELLATGRTSFPPNPGTITLKACLIANYTGTSIPTAGQTSGVDCGLGPIFSAVPHWYTHQSVLDFFAARANCDTLCQPTATKSGKKFNDMDNSGSFTAGDTPIANWPINLYKLPANTLDQTVNTAADGTYSFTMVPGTYRVCEGVGPAGFVQTMPNALTVHAGETIVSTCPGPNVWGYEFTVAGGDALTDDDFGNNNPSHKSGKKFNDLDNNKEFNAGEPGITGWPINLYKLPAATLDQTVNTGAGGSYTFTIPAAGNYRVCEGVGPAGFTQTFPHLGTIPPATETLVNTCPGPNVWGYEFTVTSGTELTGDDFGNNKPSHKSGKKFNDLDNNKEFTAGEPGIPGWPINLYKLPAATLDQTVNTGAGGSYTFTIPAAGNYRVCEGVGPAGFTQTFPHLGTIPPATETLVNTCPGPNVWGYEFTVTSGTELAGDDFGNFKPGGCLKQTVLDVMAATYPGNLGPDATVHTDLNESVQAAVDAASDTNHDGYIIVMVIAHADGSLGGIANQKVAVWKDYGNQQPFGLFGCSVTLTGGGDTDPSVWVKSSANSKNIVVNGRTTDIFVMDLHGGGSKVAGLQVEGDYRYLRNNNETANTGYGFKIAGNYNTVHNGAANGNSLDGVWVSGNFNKLDSTNSMSNHGNGFNVVGSNNQLIKLDAGDSGQGNTGDGVKVTGNSNSIQEVDAYANTLNGFEVSGTGNSLLKNVAGNRGAQANTGIGFLLSGGSSLEQNTAIANKAEGFKLLTSGFSLKNNVSGGTATGFPNAFCQYRFMVAGNTNAGGNKSNGVTLVGSPFPVSCK